MPPPNAQLAAAGPVGQVRETGTCVLLTIVTLLPVMFVVYKAPPAGPMLLFPVFLALQLAFVIGVSLILSAATTFFRDVRHFVEIGIPMLFWTTPIVYPLAQAPDAIASLAARDAVGKVVVTI